MNLRVSCSAWCWFLTGIPQWCDKTDLYGMKPVAVMNVDGASVSEQRSETESLDFPVKQTKHMLWGRSALCTAVNDLLNWMLEFIYCRLWPVTVACSWCLLFLYQASRVEMLIIGLWICQPASLIVSLSNHNCRHVEWRKSAHPKCHILLIWLKESHCWFFFHTVESLTQ